MSCACVKLRFSSSGKPLANPCRCTPRALGALPRSLGFGALPRSLGFGALGVSNPFAAAVAAQAKTPPVVVLRPSTAANVTVASQQIQAGNAPTPEQAVNIIKTLRPPVPFKQNLPAPSKVSGKGSMASGLSGYTPINYGTHLRRDARLGALGSQINVAQTAETTAIGAKVGTAVIPVPGVGTAIGAAVGAIVGIVSGLFGHKKAVPKVSNADVQQAQAWLQQYTQVAGSVVGRNFSSEAVHDMMTAMAIANPGFWGRSASNQIDVSAVSNFVNDELPKRWNDFFNAMSSVPMGGTVTMSDDCSILGHGKSACHPDITFSFENPGVNAPSYVLGPIFAQYFYSMCMIFYTTTSNCAGHLTAPFPQMHTDLIDWFRSGRPGWDTPQPNVVTGTDVSIAAPAQASPGTSVSTIAPPSSIPVNAPVNTGAAVPVSSAPGLLTLPGASSVPSVASAAPLPGNALSLPASTLFSPTPVATDSGSAFSLPSLFSSGTDSSVSSALPASVVSAANPAPATAGMGWVGIGLLALVGIPFLLKRGH